MGVGLIPPNNPAAAPGGQLLGVFTASAGASIDCSQRNQGSYSGNIFQSDFDIYEIEFVNIVPGTNSVSPLMRFSTNSGVSYDSGANYKWTNFRANNVPSTGTGGSGADTSINLATTNLDNTASEGGMNGFVKFYNPLNAAAQKMIVGLTTYLAGGGVFQETFVQGDYSLTTAVTNFQVLMSTGTVTGTIYVYGKSKSASTGSTNVLAGRVVQVVNTQTGAEAHGTTIIPIDDTIPQNTEGDQYMTLAITPTSATNKLKIDVVFFGGVAAPTEIIVALFQDSTANALAVGSQYCDAATGRRMTTFSHYMTAGTTSATTFKVRAGSHTGTQLTFNGTSAARLYGGVVASSITITEIAV